MIISDRSTTTQHQRTTTHVNKSKELPIWCVLEMEDCLGSYFCVQPMSQIALAETEGWRVWEDSGERAVGLTWEKAHERRENLYSGNPFEVWS